MELKLTTAGCVLNSTELLIEPYGIEITDDGRHDDDGKSLLIEPYGIEIPSICRSVQQRPVF